MRIFYEISNTPNAWENIRAEVNKIVLKDGQYSLDKLPERLATHSIID
jgi:hypothetical protein